MTLSEFLSGLDKLSFLPAEHRGRIAERCSGLSEKELAILSNSLTQLDGQMHDFTAAMNEAVVELEKITSELEQKIRHFGRDVEEEDERSNDIVNAEALINAV